MPDLNREVIQRHNSAGVQDFFGPDCFPAPDGIKLIAIEKITSSGQLKRATMTSVEDVKKSILDSIAAAESHTEPYPYFLVENVVPQEILPQLQNLPFPAPELGGISGTREVHNKSRNYFDADNCSKYDACKLLAEALQSEEVVSAVQTTFNTDLSDTYLRIEYAQDTDGFWLEPHTDIGVKSFTMLLYLSDGEGYEALGTSIYADKETHVGESPFAPNLAMIFVPSNNTWHGFETRPVKGVRKSIIINYVTQDWRAREQLAFPESTVPVG
jgi:hypothetical protein